MHACMHACWGIPQLQVREHGKKNKNCDTNNLYMHICMHAWMYACMHACMHAGASLSWKPVNLEKSIYKEFIKN